MAPTKYASFLAGSLSGDLSEVPGLGKDHGIPTLQAKGIRTTYQLIGHFLKLGRNKEAFCKFLVEECGGIAHHVRDTAKAIEERVGQRGFKCEIRLSDHVIQTATSRFSDAAKTAFLQQKLSNKLSSDFYGIKDETKFAAAGIKTTDALFGAFLSIIDNPSPAANTSKCDEFYGKLNALGASPGHKSVIIYQLQSKLAVGIDTHGPEALKLKHLLPAVREVSNETLDEEAFDARKAGSSEAEPQTGGLSRKSAAAASATAATPRKLDFAAGPAAPSPVLGGGERKQEQPGSSLAMMAVFGLLMAVGACVFLLSPEESGPAALPMPEAGTWL